MDPYFKRETKQDWSNLAWIGSLLLMILSGSYNFHFNQHWNRICPQILYCPKTLVESYQLGICTKVRYSHYGEMVNETESIRDRKCGAKRKVWLDAHSFHKRQTNKGVTMAVTACQSDNNSLGLLDYYYIDWRIILMVLYYFSWCCRELADLVETVEKYRISWTLKDWCTSSDYDITLHHVTRHASLSHASYGTVRYSTVRVPVQNPWYNNIHMSWIAIIIHHHHSRIRSHRQWMIVLMALRHTKPNKVTIVVLLLRESHLTCQ